MTEDKIRQSVVNYLDGQNVIDVDADLDDFMSNVIDAAAFCDCDDGDDSDREWIEDIARDELERHCR